MSRQADELVDLVTRLREIEERIVELTEGSVDAITDSQGRPWLLSRAQQELRERSELQRQFSEQQTAILNALPAHIALLDANANIIDVNEAWRHFSASNSTTGSQDSIGFNYLDVCDAAPGEAFEAHRTAAGIRAILAGESDSFSLEYPCHGPDTKRWFNMVATPLRSFQQRGAVVMHIDITDRKLAELELRRAAGFFSASNDGVVIIDTEGFIVDVNPAYSRISGFSQEELKGKRGSIHLRLNGPEMERKIEEALEARDHWSGELRAQRKDGEVYVQKVSVSTVRDDSGQVVNYITVVNDITRLKAHEAELDRVAHYDVLTGLPNRRLLTDRLEQAVRHARRHAESLAVCYLDLDNFKPINDRWGHEAGDRVLVDVARRLENCLRESDTLSRIGGDEFVFLLPSIDGGSELDQVLERLLSTLQEPLTVNGGTARVSSSVGVALFPDDAEDPDTLLRFADQAMYSAKAAGRNRYFRFDSREVQQMEERKSQLQSIIDGLKHHEFILQYQPKVDLRDGSLIGVEALVRWQHPERGLLSPAEFLGIVIDSDYEIRFGEYVLETALAQLDRWQEQGLHIQVSINVSGNELRQAGLADRIASRLAQHVGIHPSQLEIEVLETTAIKDIDQVLVALTQCRSTGIQVSLDDFGTGYSSLTIFRRLPVDTLKIDQSFIRDMLVDSNDRSIVESVIHMARAFNRNVVAEGVETMEHARVLLEMGCFQVQGHGIAPPMDAAAIPDWIREWQRQRVWESLRG